MKSGEQRLLSLDRLPLELVPRDRRREASGRQ
jgi:hypothetical protein